MLEREPNTHMLNQFENKVGTYFLCINNQFEGKVGKSSTRRRARWANGQPV